MASGFLIGATIASAGDNDLWREQVSTDSSYVNSFNVGQPGGSSFLDAVRENHFPVIEYSVPRLLGGNENGTGNWFFKTITPQTYNYES